jgi:hypothetical protein
MAAASISPSHLLSHIATACPRSTHISSSDRRTLRCGHSPGPGDRKKRLARLLGKWRIGDALSVGLEGIVSKRLRVPYRSGLSPD